MQFAHNNQSKKRRYIHLLKNPIVIILAVCIGFWIGLSANKGNEMMASFAAAIEPFGQLYLHLIKMCVVPILVTAIISSLGKIIQDKHARQSLSSMVLVFAAALFCVSLIGTTIGLIGKPGKLNDEQLLSIGEMINRSEFTPDIEVSLNENTVMETQSNQSFITGFLFQLIPENVFASLGEGKALQLVFFSIIFGMAVGYLGKKELVDLTHSFFEAFQKIVEWAMYGIAPAIICLLANQVAGMGVNIVSIMARFLLLFYLAGFLLILISFAVIWYRSRKSFSVTFNAVIQPVLVALSTRNSFATLPAAIDALENKLELDDVSTNLFFPLGLTTCRYGNVIYFSIATLFVVQLYAASTVSVGVVLFLQIIIGCIFAGLATAGASGIVTLTMISIVLTPLGLPLDAVLVIFIAVDTIADPMRTLLIVKTNMAATAILAKSRQIPDLRD